MTRKHLRRPAAALLAAAMALSLAWTGVSAKAVDATYTFSAAELTAAADKEELTGGSFADGYITTFGTLTKRTSSDGSVKSVEVGKNGDSGFTFTVAGTASVAVEFSSTGGSNTSTVGLWNEAKELAPSVEGVTTVSGTGKTVVTYTGLTAGVYQVVSPDASEHKRGARVYSISITETTEGERAPRSAWADVAAPVVTGAAVEDGKLTVSYTMAVGYDGADSVKVSLIDVNAPDAPVDTVEGDAGVAVFTPAASGKYTVTVIASRAGEADKTAAWDGAADYLKPLSAPVISSVTSTGGGKINVVWEAVSEATGYNVYADGGDKAVNKAPVTALEYEVSGLKVGSDHTFTVTALRDGEESAPAKAVEGTATKEAQQAWSFATFGASTKTDKNYSEGDLNRDGKVTVISSAGAGKILANSTDGLAFYYTAIPVDKNFTLRAKVHVNSWENRSSQNGFGVAALDRVGTGSKEFWNNSVLVGGMRYAYYYDDATDTVYAEADPNHVGSKYNMRLGIASLFRSGVTHDGLDAMGGDVTSPPGFTTATQPMDRYALDEGKAPGTYNLVANGTALECDSLDAPLADYVLEVQRNNTGYFTAYYDADGKLISQSKTYDPKALDQLDAEFVYAGFFTSRLMDATFSDVTLKINDPKDDPAPEAKPKTQLIPKLLVYSADRANTEDYTLIASANAVGKVDVKLDGKSVAKGEISAPGARCDIPVKIKPGSNEFTVVFTPDAKQSFDDPDVELGSAEPSTVKHTVAWDNGYAGRKYLYAAPAASGSGSRFDPMSITEAVEVAAPGQTILLREGTYHLTGVLTVKKGMSGTQDKPIYMIADPAAAAKPVLDFGGKKGGVELDGDWWYIRGIGITGADGEGINIAGSHNTLDQVDTYRNLATGVQISRSSRVDSTIDYWPSDNLVLNCTSYENADPGYSDADGFGAKLTAGRGNVFDGCIAYHNADDGWDLYAKAEQGPIGTVVVKNCVAYKNGYLADGTNAGDGNGFKLGGESITGYHELHNSVAFYNKNCGVTTNSCPDVQLFNVTSFDNEHLNLNFYTKLAKNTDFAATGYVGFMSKPSGDYFDQFAPTGSQDKSKVLNDANYLWDGVKSVNASGAELKADVFVSLEFAGVTRKADGTIDMGDFLKKSDTAPAGAGADLSAGTPSKVFEPIVPTVTTAGQNGETVVTSTYPDGEVVQVSTAANGDRRLATFDSQGSNLRHQVILPGTLPNDAAAFADVPAGHWARQDVAELAALGLVRGVDLQARLYAPTVPVTRGSLAEILFRLCGSKNQANGDRNPDGVPLSTFYPTSEMWALDTGVMTGYADGSLGADDPITREQMAVMLRRFAILLGLDVSANTAALDDYADGAAVGDWAEAGLAWAVNNGIISGKEGKVLDPQGTASRAECAVMVNRFRQVLRNWQAD